MYVITLILSRFRILNGRSKQLNDDHDLLLILKNVTFSDPDHTTIAECQTYSRRQRQRPECQLWNEMVALLSRTTSVTIFLVHPDPVRPRSYLLPNIYDR